MKDDAWFASERARLGKIVRRLRQSTGLIETELAQALNTSQSVIDKNENGIRWLDIIELDKIANVVGTTLLCIASEYEAGYPAIDSTKS